MPYFFMMTIVLVLCWMMMINLGKLTKDRMMMQNAADNAAMSVAAYRARCLNILGAANYNLATILYGTKVGVANYYKYGVTLSVEGAPAGLPIPIWPMGGIPFGPGGLFEVDNQKKIASVGDLAAGNGKQAISAVKNLSKAPKTLQDGILKAYNSITMTALATDIARKQERNASGEYTGADIALVTQGGDLGLERNDLGVVYYESKKMQGLAAIIAKAAVKILLSAAEIPGEIKDIYKAKKWSDDDNSWLYVENKADFNTNNKIVVIATKNAGSSSNSGYPFGAKFFGLSDWPAIQTVAAAAVYNVDGPMFVFEKNDKISPVIKAYQEAGKGGWDAHLVPVKVGVQH